MELQRIDSHVSATAMNNLQETIYENGVLNKEADHVRSIVIEFFNSQEHERYI